MPQRIQLSRRRGWRMPAGTVKVDRSTIWGNPYQSGAEGDGDTAYLAGLFRAYIERPEQRVLAARVASELRGKNLACWCPLDKPCHANVLLDIANQP